ncbi:hypothetical protein V8F33_011101 [Rhypophila sp. PSN 637]
MTSNIPTAISDKAAEVLTQLENWKQIDKQNYTARPNDAASLFRTWCIDNCVFYRRSDVPRLEATKCPSIFPLGLMEALSRRRENPDDQVSDSDLWSCLQRPGIIHRSIIKIVQCCQAIRENGFVSQVSSIELSHDPNGLYGQRLRGLEFQASTPMFAEYIAGIVHKKVPEAPSFLQERLVQSIVLRRNKFLCLEQIKSKTNYPPFPGHVEPFVSTSKLSGADKTDGKSKEVLRNLLDQERRKAEGKTTTSSHRANPST